MLTPRIGTVKNRRERLPEPGEIVAVEVSPLQYGHRWRKFIVESYPVCDRYMNLITHCVNVRALDNGQRFTVSGFYCMGGQS
jgi:hypothetical protein